eukprot:1149958-Pelagomonas_calceolata.AAC.1
MNYLKFGSNGFIQVLLPPNFRLPTPFNLSCHLRLAYRGCTLRCYGHEFVEQRSCSVAVATNAATKKCLGQIDKQRLKCPSREGMQRNKEWTRLGYWEANGYVQRASSSPYPQ